MSIVEAKKWRNLALAVSGLGIIILALPWIPNKVKVYSAVPLYMIFVYLYYQYICLKKSAASDKSDSLNKGNNAREGYKKTDIGKDKKSNKRGR